LNVCLACMRTSVRSAVLQQQQQQKVILVTWEAEVRRIEV
jgi:hypothetical protein